MNSPSDFLCCPFRKWGTSSLATDVEMFGSKQGLDNKKPTFSSQSSLELSSFFRSKGPMVNVFVRKSSISISFGREIAWACAHSRRTGVIWLKGRRTQFHSKLIPCVFLISTSQSSLTSAEKLENISKWCCWVEELYSWKGKTSLPSNSSPTSSAFCTPEFSFPSLYLLEQRNQRSKVKA